MNLRDLEYLVAIEDHGNFGRAAEACHVSQPTLSMQVKKLEQYLGVTLIERHPREFFFTPVGKRVVEQARIVLREAAAIRTLAALEKDPEAGTIRLGIIPTVAPYWLPWMMPAIRNLYPRLDLELTEDRTAHLVTRLQDGSLDLLFLAIPLEDPAIETLEVVREPFFLAVSRSSPLARRSRIQKDDLEGQEILLLEEGHCFRDQALEVCHRAGAVEKSSFKATSLETIRHMVAGGAGMTLIPERAVSAHDGLRYVPFQSPVPSRSLGFAWRRSYPRARLVQDLGRKLRTQLRTRG